jgi:type 1 fimbria pilin
MKKAKSLGLSALTATMILSSGVAFAAGDTEVVEMPEVDYEKIDSISSPVEVTGAGAQAEMTIDINMPTEFDYILNPYEIENKAQVYAPTCSITNNGNTGIKVTLTSAVAKIETGTGGTAATLATAPITSTSTKKEAFLWINCDAETKDVKEEYEAKSDSNKVVSATAKAVNVSLGVLNAGGGDDATGNVLKFKVDGSLNGNASWTADDKITVTPIFTFATWAIPQE